MEHHDDLLPRLAQRVDETIFRLGQPHMRAVVPFRLTAVGKPRKDDDGLCAFRSGKRFFEFFFRSLAVRAEPAHIAHPLRKRESSFRLPGVDMRTPAALKARSFSKFAHEEHVFPERKRQRALVL